MLILISISLLLWQMDRASILGDAIEYLKELLQRISDLHNELESAPSSSLVGPTSASFNPSTPTLQTFPGQVKEELCPGSFPSPTGQQSTVSPNLVIVNVKLSTSFSCVIQCYLSLLYVNIHTLKFLSWEMFRQALQCNGTDLYDMTLSEALLSLFVSGRSQDEGRACSQYPHVLCA
jgi:hypothetical protein